MSHDDEFSLFDNIAFDDVEQFEIDPRTGKPKAGTILPDGTRVKRIDRDGDKRKDPVARSATASVARANEEAIFDLSETGAAKKPDLKTLYPTMKQIREEHIGSNGLKMIGSFDGSGGSITGFAWAGWKELASGEFVKAARDCLAANYVSRVITPEEVVEAAREVGAERGYEFVSRNNVSNKDESVVIFKNDSRKLVVLNKPRKLLGQEISESIDWESTLDNATANGLGKEIRQFRHDVCLRAFEREPFDPNVTVIWGDDIRGQDPFAMMTYLGLERGELDCFEGSPPCFPANTPVLTTVGAKYIQDVQIGDVVLTHRGNWKRVVNTMSRQSPTVIVNGEIECTPDHPFYAWMGEGATGAESEFEFVRAVDLPSKASGLVRLGVEVGDGVAMYERNGHTFRIEAGEITVEPASSGTTVYDLTVEDDHSFIAGMGLVVHNCKSFSVAGIGNKGWGRVLHYSEERNQRTDDLFAEYVRMVDGFRPRSFVAENVYGISIGRAGEEMMRPLLERFRKLGYRVEVRLLDSKDYGIPQSRPRIFFQGIREDLVRSNGKQAIPEWPEPSLHRYTCGDVLEAAKDENTPEELAWSDFRYKRRQSVKKKSKEMSELLADAERDAVEDAEAPAETEKEFYETYHNWLALRPGDSPKNKAFQFIRCHPDLPVPTVTQMGAKIVPGAGPAHPFEPRKFTITEYKLIFSYPKDYTLVGTLSQQAERLGRSVTTKIMMEISSTLADVLNDSTSDGSVDLSMPEGEE